MSQLRHRTDCSALFGSFSDQEKRELGQWNLEVLGVEQQRRLGKQEFSDEELLERLTGIVPADQLAANGIDFYRQSQQVSDGELARLIEIQKLYKTSSPYSSGRIRIYKDISQLAPWDETCLLKISAEFENNGEPLKAYHWLREALQVNPDNVSAREKLESFTAATRLLRGRAAVLRFLKYASVVAAVLLLGWCTGYRISWDETRILDALAGLQDTQTASMPSHVEAGHLIRHVYTGYERVKLDNPHGGSFVILATSPYRRLQHGSVVGGRKDDIKPLEANTSRFSIRGRDAEFIYEEFEHYETVSGYYQGKQHPVSVRARLEFSDQGTLNRAPSGGAPGFIRSFEPAAVE